MGQFHNPLKVFSETQPVHLLSPFSDSCHQVLEVCSVNLHLTLLNLTVLLHRVGKSRFTVLSAWNSLFLHYYLLVIVLFSMENCKSAFVHPCILWKGVGVESAWARVPSSWRPCFFYWGPVQQVRGRAWIPAFLTRPQVMLRLPVYGPHFEKVGFMDWNLISQSTCFFWTEQQIIWLTPSHSDYLDIVFNPAPMSMQDKIYKIYF